MNPVKKVTVWTKINVKKGLPKPLQRVYAITDGFKRRSGRDRLVVAEVNVRNEWDDNVFIEDDEKVTHWLEKQENKILLSEEAARKLFSDVWDAAYTYHSEEYQHFEHGQKIEAPDKDTFINNLLK